MANYVSCNIEVIRDNIDEVINYLKSDEMPLDFNQLIKQPEGLTDEESHDWRVENWGTRCNASSVTVNRASDDCVVYDFITVNTEPRPIVEALAKSFPDAFIEYEYSDDAGWSEYFTDRYAKGKLIEKK